MKKKKGQAKAALPRETRGNPKSEIRNPKRRKRAAGVSAKKPEGGKTRIPGSRATGAAKGGDGTKGTDGTDGAKLSARQEKFCQLYVRSGTAAEAYRQAYGNTKTADAASSRLLSTVKVAARVKALQALAAAGAVLTLQETLEYFRKVVLTPIGEVDERSVLCQSAEHSDTGTKFKMPDKLKALELNAKLQGWLREKVEHSIEADALATLMTKIRDGGKAEG